MSAPSASPERLLDRPLLSALLVPSFYGMEWGLVAASAALFTLLNHHGFSELEIWLLFWAVNLTISAAVVALGDRLKVDLTLMATLRRLVDAVGRRSLWLGRLLEIAVLIRLLLWDGACQLLIFLRCRLRGRRSQAALLVLASGFQMLFWAKLYAFGQRSITALLHSIP